MPAKSKSQQRYMAMIAHGVIDAPKGLSKKEARKFAKTKHKGLPERVKEGKMKFIEYLINEAKKDRPAGRRNTELQFFVDGNGPFNVMTSKGDIHDTYETHKEAQSVANQLNQKYGITR